jgi:hypothetical protein
MDEGWRRVEVGGEDDWWKGERNKKKKKEIEKKEEIFCMNGKIKIKDEVIIYEGFKEKRRN